MPHRGRSASGSHPFDTLRPSRLYLSEACGAIRKLMLSRRLLTGCALLVTENSRLRPQSCYEQYYSKRSLIIISPLHVSLRGRAVTLALLQKLQRRGMPKRANDLGDSVEARASQFYLVAIKLHPPRNRKRVSMAALLQYKSARKNKCLPAPRQPRCKTGCSSERLLLAGLPLEIRSLKSSRGPTLGQNAHAADALRGQRRG